MGTSDIAITALAATPTLRGNKLKATVLATGPAANIPNLLLQTVIFYASLTNDFAAAAEVARGNPEALDAGLIEERTYYYWARAIDASGNLGAVYPASPTAGVACKAIGLSGLAFGLANGRIEASAPAGALTVSIKTSAGTDPTPDNPVYMAFPNDSGGIGSYSILSIVAALSLTLPSGMKIGGGVGQPLRLWLVLFNDDGVLRLSIKNCSDGARTIFPLLESGIEAATAASTSANNFGVFYASQAIGAKPYRIVGYMDWAAGFAVTIGVWTVPDLVRMFSAGMPKPGDSIQDFSQSAQQGLSTTSLIPYDNTIPQSSEGGELLAVPFTPKSACNFIEIEVLMSLRHTAISAVIAAIFIDSATDAVVVGWTYVAVANGPAQMHIRYRLPAASTATRTYRIRAGAAVAGTLTVNVYMLNTASPFIRVAELTG